MLSREGDTDSWEAKKDMGVRQDLVQKDMDMRTALDTIRDRKKSNHFVKTSS